MNLLKFLMELILVESAAFKFLSQKDSSPFLLPSVETQDPQMEKILLRQIAQLPVAKMTPLTKLPLLRIL